mmetsp:Transcript_42244/g.111200  ORF Transcript_42244/g.111200 Transcript_42244/m.111200 type:complete len:198 (+) Transcript_42244:109-702(+)
MGCSGSKAAPKFKRKTQLSSCPPAGSLGASTSQQQQQQQQYSAGPQKKVARFSEATPDGSGPAKGKQFDPVQFNQVKRDFMAVTKVERWAEDKDIANMLGTLTEFANEFPTFSTPISPKLIDVLRSKPQLLRKAFLSAAHVLHPHQMEQASPAVQSLAAALLQALDQTFERWEEEEEPYIQGGDGELMDSDASCVIQ